MKSNRVNKLSAQDVLLGLGLIISGLSLSLFYSNLSYGQVEILPGLELPIGVNDTATINGLVVFENGTTVDLNNTVTEGAGNQIVYTVTINQTFVFAYGDEALELEHEDDASFYVGCETLECVHC